MPPPVAANAGQRGDVPHRELVMPPRQSTPAACADPEVCHNSFKDTQRNDTRRICRRPFQHRASLVHVSKGPARSPIKRQVSFCEMAGTCGQRAAIQPSRVGEIRPQPRPLEPHIAVRRVDCRVRASIDDHLGKRAPPPAEKWAQQGQRGSTGHKRYTAHSCQTANSRAAIEPHEQRFSLIVGMMRGDERCQSRSEGPIAQRGIARRPRPRLHGRSGFQTKRQNSMGNAARCAQRRHRSGLCRAFAAQTVIDRGDRNRTGQRRSHQFE